MCASGALVPPISWAQRPEYVLLTIALQDTTNVTVEMKEEGKVLYFSCTAPEDKHYAYTLHFYAPISPEESQHVVRPRQIELKLKKKFHKSLEEAEDDEVEWPRLTEEKTKHSNINIDWSKWKDAGDNDAGSDDLGDFGLDGDGGGDEMDEQYSEMLSQLMAAQGQQDAEQHAGLPAGGLPTFGAAAGQKPSEGAEEEDDDLPPLEEDAN
ncbi:hypothetical protein ABB37_03182 [Leptomonas pyrrhocoris]|uniref:CS domain-containing protein n=1 Tax=Leptomonas pyrrhocoris TaxID=157538 RepID=A0A0M9G4K9_LEPPY|nr:hypothetical protein ABB37_03182 [Leptomonas pyrrhocoris]XP_015660445.1 hypothetical protein ABB37_03182 [Leptomonas pyrrhocoris]KPA82005.1 hypothetical protein ABB37_03182 [Leptomonas pyrrhocoris]KPA82006.1 hypothetical protein ABB37_03182 [Leptomonas pyrrhocoris]|eukprot:XP_015660444.1 hypothetical protein ABB37_03182 [Leptomonas pyrrhocoris]